MIITEKDVHSNEKRGPVREEIKNIHLRILPNKQRIEQLARKPLRVSDACAEHTVGKPQEEGMMSTAASFPLVRNQGLIDQ